MVHLLIDARVDLIRAVIGYNESQFRLYVALGQPPPRAMPVSPPQAVPNTGMPPAVRTRRPGRRSRELRWNASPSTDLSRRSSRAQRDDRDGLAPPSAR